MFAAAGLVVFVLEAGASFTILFVFFPVATGEFAFGNKSSLSIVTVAGVHVDAEPTAVRMESAVACREPMMIANTDRCVQCYWRLDIIQKAT